MEIEKLKQKILDLAIRGKLVPQDPNDEPASVLIDRIRAEKEELIKQGKIKRSKEDSYIYKGSDNCYYEKVGDNVLNISKKIQFNVPENWTWCRLGSITKIITKGTTPRDGNVAYKKEGIGFLRAENILGLKKLSKEDMKYIDEETHKGFLKRSILEADDILITIAGSLGRTAIVEKNFLPLNTNQAVSIVRLLDLNLVDKNYLIYALNSPIIQTQLMSQQKITAIPNLTLEIISSCLIPLPPLSYQKKISYALDALLSKIEFIQNEKLGMNDFITKAKSKILDDIFGENSRYKSYYTHYGTLSDFGTLISGRDLKPDEYNDDNNGVPYLTGASNFENDTVIINRWTPFPVVISLENDVLITCKGTIGKTAINKIKKCHIARQIMAFRCNEKVLPEFLKLYFEYMTTTLQKASSSLIPGITRSIMLSLNIAFPPIEKQQEIIENTQKIMLILESIIS